MPLVPRYFHLSLKPLRRRHKLQTSCGRHLRLKEFLIAMRARAMFSEIGKVLTHPRCINCHPAGDRPTQDNDMHPHQPPAWPAHASPAIQTGITRSMSARHIAASLVMTGGSWRRLKWPGKAKQLLRYASS